MNIGYKQKVRVRQRETLRVRRGGKKKKKKKELSLLRPLTRSVVAIASASSAVSFVQLLILLVLTAFVLKNSGRLRAHLPSSPTRLDDLRSHRQEENYCNRHRQEEEGEETREGK